MKRRPMPLMGPRSSITGLPEIPAFACQFPLSANVPFVGRATDVDLAPDPTL